MNNTLIIPTDRLLEAIKQMEGFAGESFLDTLAKPPVWTIGYGYTCDLVGPRQTMTEQDASDLLVRVLRDKYGAGVLKLATVPLTQSQFDALVDFAYNEGLGALATSTLLRYVNASEFDDVLYEFSKWDLAGGVVLPGLVKRRELEASWFAEGMEGVEHA